MMCKLSILPNPDYVPSLIDRIPIRGFILGLELEGMGYILVLEVLLDEQQYTDF